MESSRVTRRSAQGGYARDQFLITFSADLPFVSLDRRPTKEYFHLFGHEYWHYWINLSTIAGLKQFVVGQQLVALFSSTLAPTADGTSIGSACLGSDEFRVAELLTIDTNVEGDLAPSGVSTDVIALEVKGARIVGGQVSFGGGAVPGDHVEIDLLVTRTGGSDAATMILGTAAIEEGVALLVESHIEQQTTGAYHVGVPVFPYRVLEQTVAYLVKRTLPRFHVAALGTLALLTSHPGPGLVVLAEKYERGFEHAVSRGALPSVAEEAALVALIAATAEIRTRSIALVESDLRQIAAMHHDRGLLEGAARYFTTRSFAALDLRRRDPIFDLRAVFVDKPIGSLLEFQRLFASCDVLQERPGPADLVGRDVLFVVSEELRDTDHLRPSDYLRTFQAQQDYARAHLDLDSGAFMSSTEARSKCPYFTTCTLDLRAEQPKICGTEPWKAFDRGAPEGCWYGIAVAGTLGTVKITRGKPR